MSYAFDRSVIEIDVGNLKSVWYGLRQNGEVVVLARYLYMACREILDRVVTAVMPEL